LVLAPAFHLLRRHVCRTLSGENSPTGSDQLVMSGPIDPVFLDKLSMAKEETVTPTRQPFENRNVSRLAFHMR
jgi:hypothetical protein